MAETPQGKGAFGFLTQKAGPLPIGVWLIAGVAIWWYFGRKNSAAQTDPAGNTGTIDPQTGYVYGSPEDQAALQQAGGGAGGAGSGDGGGGTGTGTGPGGATAGGQYPDDNAWAQAAINYLAARGIDPAQASQAIELYLASQTLTTAQQADVNLAIQGIGPPPQIPGPAQSGPGQQILPPAGGNPGSGGTSTTGPFQPVQYPAPSGLSAYAVSDTGYRIKWNPVTGPHGEKPTGYTIATYQMNGKKVDQFTVGGTDTAEYGAGGGGLHPGWQYRTDVWANGGQQAPPHASVVVTLKTK